jgi:hypothetical protein
MYCEASFLAVSGEQHDAFNPKALVASGTLKGE